MIVIQESLVQTAVVSVIAALALTSVSLRTDGALTVFVNLAGLIHLTVRLVLDGFPFCFILLLYFDLNDDDIALSIFYFHIRPIQLI